MQRGENAIWKRSLQDTPEGWSLIKNFLLVTFLGPRIRRWFIGFLNFVDPSTGRCKKSCNAGIIPTLQITEFRITYDQGSRHIVFGKTTRYGFNGSGSESRQGQEIFSSPESSRVGLRSTQPPMQWVPGFLLEGQAAGT
jgi:hypothetical protein